MDCAVKMDRYMHLSSLAEHLGVSEDDIIENYSEYMSEADEDLYCIEDIWDKLFREEKSDLNDITDKVVVYYDGSDICIGDNIITSKELESKCDSFGSFYAIVNIKTLEITCSEFYSEMGNPVSFNGYVFPFLVNSDDED